MNVAPTHEEFTLPPAQPGDPGLGVYALTQFVYCARAGIITAEQADPDADEQPEMRRLDFLPRWSLVEIERRLAELFKAGFVWLGMLAAITVGSLTGLFFWPLPSLLFAISGTAFVIWRVATNIRQGFTLSMLRREANEALPIEPVLPFSEPEPINWWQLFQAGFISRPYLEKLSDDAIRLTGKPWRVLQRGTLRIPVWRFRGEAHELKEKHLVRMAALCHLVEVSTGQESPFGIILWPNSFDGVAIPKSNANLAKVDRALREARRILKSQSSVASEFPHPPPESVCAHCPLGSPQRHVRGVTECTANGSPVPIHPACDANREIYHSNCGDRFRWLPPHEWAKLKELEPGN